MNKTIEKIESYISNINAITVYYSFEADDAHKEQLQQIASKTIAVFKETIDRLKTVRQQISDDEEFAKFLNRVSEKVESVYTVTLEKLKKEQEASLQKQLQGHWCPRTAPRSTYPQRYISSEEYLKQ